MKNNKPGYDVLSSLFHDLYHESDQAILNANGAVFLDLVLQKNYI